MHREPTTGDTIWWSELNTTTWTVEQALNELGQPSLAPGATKLVMSHGSSASNHAIFYTTFQSGAAAGRRTQLTTAASPALPRR